MSSKKVDVTLHIDEETTHEDREDLFVTLLGMPGVKTASCRDKHQHLMVIEYDPDRINPKEFVVAAEHRGYHSELIGML
ncbi:ATP-binding protein [Pseudomonadota bacterium]